MPYLTSGLASGSYLKFLSDIGVKWQNLLGQDQNLQSILQSLIGLIMGNGPDLKTAFSDPNAGTNSCSLSDTYEKSQQLIKADLNITPQNIFEVPPAVGALLNIPSSEDGSLTFAKFYRYLFGVQKYNSNNSVFRKSKKQKLQDILNPASYQPTFRADTGKSNFYFTQTPVEGLNLIKPEYFNQSTGWSILSQYVNTPINELYTTYRLSPEGFIMPFLVFRQIPFSSGYFVKKYQNGTSFLSLPRWKIDPSLVYSVSTGRDDALRFNFVQIYGIPFGYFKQGAANAIGIQAATNSNFVADENDIRRSGLRPYVIQNSFDFSTDKNSRTVLWAKLMGDAIIGSHMKLSGSISCQGIEYPLSVGDNVEFDGIVYHIEGVSHEGSISANGMRQFRTTIMVSHGVDASSNDQYTIYGERANYLYEDEFNDDYQRNQILPGVTVDDNNDT
jgi:hypothetical protein